MNPADRGAVPLITIMAGANSDPLAIWLRSACNLAHGGIRRRRGSALWRLASGRKTVSPIQIFLDRVGFRDISFLAQ